MWFCGVIKSSLIRYFKRILQLQDTKKNNNNNSKNNNQPRSIT